jgi:hypothetical protein
LGKSCKPFHCFGPQQGENAENQPAAMALAAPTAGETAVGGAVERGPANGGAHRGHLRGATVRRAQFGASVAAMG